MIEIDINDRDKIAIVAVGYNRIEGLKRLLDSVNAAYYPSEDIPLVISIDCSGNRELYDFVLEYKWFHGKKYVNIENERLGLKKHIFQCGDLTYQFKGIILLEDDIFVSPMFYQYTTKAFEKYENDSNIAAISLYTYENNFLNNFIPFQPLYKGADVFAFQIVSSWGQAWNKRMWSSFQDWLTQWDEDFSKIDIPNMVKSWTRAWTKYFYAYMRCSGTYYLFPYYAYSTNFNDCGGEHGGSSDALVQSCLVQGGCNLKMPDFEDLVRYDVYFQNESILDSLNIDKNQVLVDLYGIRDIDFGKYRYILTTDIKPYRIIQSWALSLRPIELNVMNNILGRGIYLYDLTVKHGNFKSKTMTYDLMHYCLHGFSYKHLLKYSLQNIKAKVKFKLGFHKI